MRCSRIRLLALRSAFIQPSQRSNFRRAEREQARGYTYVGKLGSYNGGTNRDTNAQTLLREVVSGRRLKIHLINA